MLDTYYVSLFICLCVLSFDFPCVCLFVLSFVRLIVGVFLVFRDGGDPWAHLGEPLGTLGHSLGALGHTLDIL